MSDDKDTTQSVETGNNPIPPRYITHSDDSVDTQTSSIPYNFHTFGQNSEDDK